MKNVLFCSFVLLALGSSAFAGNVTFLSDSKLSVELQSKIAAAVQSKCASLNDAAEYQTTVETMSGDQGANDTAYITTFQASWNFDGQHPMTTWISVASFEWAVSGPDGEKLQVMQVTDSQGSCR